jgi:nuclear pore complex protein Nup160
MADIALSYSHKEARLNLESAVPGSTVAIRLPAHGTSSWSSRAAQKRPLPTDIPPAEDESAFRQRHVASAASIYYRQHHQSPRGFLWRVLENGRVLSIQAADLCKQDKAPDTHLTLRLALPSPIRPLCIALADDKQHDVLSIFVLTESNHLYTLTIRPEFFRRRSSTEDNVGDWCKIYASSAFSFKHPLRLVAPSSEQLLISLHDGGLLRLDRVPGEDSSVWKETFYNEGGWTHGLRSLIPFQGNNTIRHGKVNIELSAITSIASPSTTINGVPFAFTVSLDHRIRAWNLATGRVAFSRDLLNQERLPNELGKYVIHPSQSQLIKVYQDSEGKILIVTFSPIGAGQFKFWTLALAEEGSLELEDLFPDDILEPPTPTADVWTLADFLMAFDKRTQNSVTLRALWKNNTTYRLHSLDFILDSPASTRNSWADNWTAAASETLADTLLPTVSASDSADVTEKWLEYILFPGRFTAATIETALAIYERGLGSSKNAPVRSSKNLAKRMCSVVASTTIMDRNSEGEMEYEKFRAATDTQWRRFYRLLVELDKQRGEALSLAFDTEHEMAWVVTADGLSAIRDCSRIEQVFHNPDSVHPGAFESVAQLITAALNLRDSFSNSFLQSCDAVLTAELFGHPPTDLNSVQILWDKCNLAGQILDDDYRQLLATFGGSFNNVKIDTYKALLNMMTAAEEMDQRLERLPLAALGRKTIIRGVQEMVELHRSICFDQLVLLMFFDIDVDQADVDLETFPIYTQLFIMLKRLELLRWLFKSQITMSMARLERSSPTKRPEEMKTVTVLEGCVGHLLGLVSHSGESASSLLTEILIRVCDPDGEYELQPALIQCFLLKLDRPDLALDFARFCDQDPFSIYVQGRAFLAAKDLSTAAVYFKKAAFGLGINIPLRQFLVPCLQIYSPSRSKDSYGPS